MTVVDAFPFFNELDVLRTRLHLLEGHVDLHLVSEGTHTHQGDPKPMYLDEAGSLPRKMCRIRADLTRRAGRVGRGELDNWVRESTQRDYLRMWLEGSGLAPETLVVSSDADELWDPRVLDRILEATEQGPVILGMRMIYYGAWEWPAGWHHAKAIRLRDLPDSLSALRRRFDLPVVREAGWHVSYLGDEGRLRRKVESFAHAENKLPETWERIRRGVELGQGPNGEALERLDRTDLPEQVLRLLG